MSLSVSSSSPQQEVGAPQLTPSQSQININLTATEAHTSLPQPDSIVTSVADHSHSSALGDHSSVSTIVTPLTGPPTSGLFTEPPPLIPVVSCVHDSVPATRQNPLMWSVRSAKSLYTTPLVNQLSLQESMLCMGASG